MLHLPSIQIFIWACPLPVQEHEACSCTGRGRAFRSNLFVLRRPRFGGLNLHPAAKQKGFPLQSLTPGASAFCKDKFFINKRFSAQLGNPFFPFLSKSFTLPGIWGRPGMPGMFGIISGLSTSASLLSCSLASLFIGDCLGS